jgi:hypothetical protein
LFHLRKHNGTPSTKTAAIDNDFFSVSITNTGKKYVTEQCEMHCKDSQACPFRRKVLRLSFNLFPAYKYCEFQGLLKTSKNLQI